MLMVKRVHDAAPLVEKVGADRADAPEGAGEGGGGAQRVAQRSGATEPGTRRRPDSETYR